MNGSATGLSAKRSAVVFLPLFFLAFLFACISLYPLDCHALEPPPVTPNDEFFVLNNSGIPTVPPDWRLTVDGAVASPLSLTLPDLMAYTPATQMATLACEWYTVVYPVTYLIGNAGWTGVPLNTVLADAGPLGEAMSIAFHGVDGWVKGPYGLSEVMARGDMLLAYGMNGETLPDEQGYPIRLIVPGNVGNEWMQWLERIEIGTGAPTESLVPFPVHARILEPRTGDTLGGGRHTISGLAFAGEDREVINVEVSTDGGSTWGTAGLLNYAVPDVWRHWEYSWKPTVAGSYSIVARAEDDGGGLQGESGPLFGWRHLDVDIEVEGVVIPTLPGWGIALLVLAVAGVVAVILLPIRTTWPRSRTAGGFG